jgi:hypothetical protein
MVFNEPLGYPEPNARATVASSCEKRFEYPRQMFLLATRATIPDHNLPPFFLRIRCFTNLNVKNSSMGRRVNRAGTDILEHLHQFTSVSDNRR